MFQKKEGIVFRKIHDMFYLIDIKSNYNDDKCYLYELNEIGAYLWEHIDEYNTVNALAHNLYEQIIEEIDENEIIADVKEYIDSLASEGFLEYI